MDSAAAADVGGSSLLLAGGELGTETFFALAYLGGKLGAEVLEFEDLADLDLALFIEGIGATLYPFNGLFLRLALPDPEAGDQLLRLGEGTVD